MDKFSKLLEKKKAKGELSPVETSAKASVLQHLIEDAKQQMGAGLHGLKKVTVASPDEAGLEHGLDKAKELLHSHASAMAGEDDHGGVSDEGDTRLNDDEDGDQDGDMEDGVDGAKYEDHDPDEDLDEDALNAKLQKLMQLKEKRKMPR